MSRITTLVFWSAASLGLAWLLHQDWSGSTNPQAFSKKEKILNPKHHHGAQHTAKLTGPVDLTLSVNGEAPKNVGDVYTLEGRLKSEQDIGEMNLKWILGDNVELISGSKTQVIHLLAHQEQVVSVTLKVKDQGPQRVHLRATSMRSELPFTVSSHYNSRPPARDFLTKDEMLNQKEQSSSEDQEAVENSTARQKVYY